MTKVATVQAQQMWEYLAINRKTEEFLITELNELGKAGWELTSVSFNKDLKGVAATFSWTAFLKRPLIVPPSSPTHPAELAAAHPAADSATGPSGISTGPPEIFDLRPT